MQRSYSTAKMQRSGPISSNRLTCRLSNALFKRRALHRRCLIALTCASLLLILPIVPPAGAQQFGASAPPPVPPPLVSGTKAPPAESETLTGHNFRLSALRGHVVVLDFWATWCVSCKQAMPALNKLQRDYASRGVSVVGISLDAANTAARVPATVKQLGVSYPILVGPKRNILIGEAYNADVLPSLYVIDQAGVVRWSHAGIYDSEDKDVRSLIDRLLTKSTPNSVRNGF